MFVREDIQAYSNGNSNFIIADDFFKTDDLPFPLFAAVHSSSSIKPSQSLSSPSPTTFSDGVQACRGNTEEIFRVFSCIYRNHALLVLDKTYRLYSSPYADKCPCSCLKKELNLKSMDSILLPLIRLVFKNMLRLQLYMYYCFVICRATSSGTIVRTIETTTPVEPGR